MNKYKYLLFDNDETIMDFKKSEAVAFEETYNSFNLDIKYSKDLLISYSEINLLWWKKLERGEVNKETLLVKRFEDFLSKHNLKADALLMSETYKERLSLNNHLIDGALDLLKVLSKNHEIYIITNGVSSTQHSRINSSPIRQHIKDFFVSEDIGFSKPHKEYFNYVLKKSEIKSKEECLIIGDSLSSDIKGANNMGIDCVWFNLRNERNSDLKINYEVKSMQDLKKLFKE